MRPAGFWIRLLALIIDAIIFGLIRGALGFILMFLGVVRDASVAEQQVLQQMAEQGSSAAEILGASMRIMLETGTHITMIVFLIVSFGYSILFLTLKGGTPGKLALGLRVQEKATGKNPALWRAFIREVVGKSFLWPMTLGIGAYMVAFNKQKRGLHDIAAGTVVVKLNDE